MQKGKKETDSILGGFFDKKIKENLLGRNSFFLVNDRNYLLPDKDHCLEVI